MDGLKFRVGGDGWSCLMRFDGVTVGGMVGVTVGDSVGA